MMRAIVLAVLAAGAVPARAGDAPRADGGAEAGRTGQTLAIKVTEDGFEPRELKLKRGEPTTLVFTRLTEDTCITAIDIPAEGVKDLQLPLNKAVSVTITPRKAGVEKFHCSAMGMGNGKLLVGD